MIGRTLAHYQIREKIGVGGMGEVYRAYDTKLEREVAIKTLRADLGIPGGHSRFRREALALSRLNHPVIATIHDIGSQGGLDYLVMEFVEGETLSERLRSGPLSREEILQLGLQLAEGLRAAHEHNLVSCPMNSFTNPATSGRLLLRPRRCLMANGRPLKPLNLSSSQREELRSLTCSRSMPHAFVETYNQNSKPFVWTATAESILEKIARLCKAIAGTEH